MIYWVLSFVILKLICFLLLSVSIQTLCFPLLFAYIFVCKFLHDILYCHYTISSLIVLIERYTKIVCFFFYCCLQQKLISKLTHIHLFATSIHWMGPSNDHKQNYILLSFCSFLFLFDKFFILVGNIDSRYY